MAEEFEGLTVAELKVLLKERSLPVSGKKSELIERLVNAEEVVEESDEIEAPVSEEDVQEVTVDDDSDDDSDDDFDDESDDDWDDDWDDDEDEGHVAKQKPVLSEDMKVALSLIHISEPTRPS